MRIVIGGTNNNQRYSHLSEIYVQDFGDNYHRLSDAPTTELEKQARKIRRRYKNLNEYQYALRIYNEYMSYMYNLHGGKDLFKIKLKNDLITDFVPPKPQMKNTAANRVLLKKKILLSPVKINKVDTEKLEELVESYDADTTKPDMLVYDTTHSDPIGEKLAKKTPHTPNVSNFQSIGSMNYLEEYFHNRNIQSKKKVVNTSDKPQYSLTDIADGKVQENVYDTSEKDEVVFYRGNYLRRDAIEEVQVYDRLNDLGWNSLRIMRDKGASRKITKVIKNQNQKNIKKTKKNKKKKKQSDDFLVKVMMDNDHDTFDDFEKDMLDFTAKNIFK